MPFTNEEKREHYAAQRLEKKIKDNLGPALKEILHTRDLQAGKSRYKSEIYSLVTLANIFLGEQWKDNEEEDKRTSAANKKKKKIISPYTSSILGVPSGKYESVENLLANFENWLALRDRARKDLFWLCKDVLKKDLWPDVHQVVCDQFVKKNFDGAFPDGYTINDVHEAINQQERFDECGRPTKEMILLDSRSFYKSTIDGIDAIQWMLNVPDIRILILTGEYKLGVGFLKEIKGYLYLAEGAEPSDLNLLFPEYIVRGVDGTSKEPLLLDVRKHTQVSATIWVNSIDSNLSGWHCDVKKGDDVVTDANSNSEDVRIALKEKFDGTQNILDDWGFSDNIGTRYFPNDWYGTRIASYRENPEENPVKYFCRGCWVVKPEYVEVPLKELTAEMVELTFPQKRTFKILRQKLLNNEREFRCQQLNEPTGLDKDDGFRVQFDESSLRAHLILSKEVPTAGDVYVCWDWALSANKYSDMSVGVAGRVYVKDGVWGICVLEIIYGRWRSSELAMQIVSFNKKWNPKKTLIEKSNGAELLNLEIIRQAMRFETTLDVFWKPPSVQENAKRNRIKGLESLLVDNRLYFTIGPWIDETFSQLTRYTGEKKNRGRKDDIPDALSYLSFFLPSSLGNQKDSEEMQALVKAQKEQEFRKANYERYFGGHQYKPPTPVEVPRVERKPGDIFGGNGMRAM
jgi:hypothetical protein